MYRVSCNNDIAHTIGNATFIMTEHLKELFDPNFFRYTHISTRMAYREFMLEEKKLQMGLIKKMKPMLIIRPRPVLLYDDIAFSKSSLVEPIQSVQYGECSNYLPIFRDNDKDISLSYLMNRIRVQMQCSIILDTEIQEYNVFNYLKNRFIQDRPYWKKCSLEVFISDYIMLKISELAGIPIHEEGSGSVRKFLNYLMRNSNHYFTYKEKNNSSNEEFFLYHPITMELIMSDLSMDDATKKGMIVDYTSISFTFTSEFNTVGMYQLSTERDDVELRANTVMLSSGFNANQIVPYYTINNLFREHDNQGYKLFFTSLFQVNDGLKKEEPDILDLKSLLEDSDLKDIIEYHRRNGISNEILFHFIIMKNATKLNGDLSKGKIDYKVDLEGQRILIYNKVPGATYRLLIYLNNLYIATLINKVDGLDKEYEEDLEKEK